MRLSTVRYDFFLRVRFASDSLPILLRRNMATNLPASRAMSSNPTNRKTSDSSDAPVPIRNGESELAKRVKSIIDEDESVSAFARRCGVGEGTLRNIVGGAMPRTDNLVAIADAGGVTVDWLATGRGPRRRADLQAQSTAQPPAVDMTVLTVCIQGVRENLPNASPEQFARAVMDFYARFMAMKQPQDKAA